MVGGITIVSFVALLWVVELFDTLTGHRLDNNGIRPLETDGLGGIVFAPLLHSNWDHLIANTVPGAGPRLPDDAGRAVPVHLRHRDHLDRRRLRHLADRQRRERRAYRGVRCETNHIGASGLIFGWLAFLIVFGFFTRKVWEIVVGVVVLFVYGSVLLGVLPGTPGVSWQGHLCGALAGVLAAYLLSGPERKARALRRPVRPPSLTRERAGPRPSGSSIPASAG